ncbi:hypothetical protein SNOG_09010 [Parastagonospora nodorum SN15]|uniref:Uncharacterized protein n=1 Tax=Phaeosphaeria nodorum (strain SN15 / ATCC MYA-4574 / FGSC 10173) TaxID=321614 RepID=Q0UGV4_PHANO|nr:hypothetical protein SNOG_09010 [Parastagonospora nodorum SN15]EAT83202.1 hypothetical protein SNOG_09010 [Parastagonospora nodorum SN15]
MASFAPEAKVTITTTHVCKCTACFHTSSSELRQCALQDHSLVVVADAWRFDR